MRMDEVSDVVPDGLQAEPDPIPQAASSVLCREVNRPRLYGRGDEICFAGEVRVTRFVHIRGEAR
jgi:hypothetical protein